MNIQMRDRGQITLPQAIRDQFKLKEGSHLNLRVLGSAIVLSTKSKSNLLKFEQLQRSAQSSLGGKPYTIDQILNDIDVIRQENWDAKYARKQAKSSS